MKDVMLVLELHTYLDYINCMIFFQILIQNSFNHTVDIYRQVLGKKNVIGVNMYILFATVSLTNLSLRAKSNKTDAKL